MAYLLSVEVIRDIVIIIYGILGILFLIVAIAVAAVLGFTVKGLIGQVRRLIDEDVKGTLQSVRGTAESVRGTADFVGQTAVTPIIKTYGFVSGIRKGIGVITGLRKED